MIRYFVLLFVVLCCALQSQVKGAYMRNYTVLLHPKAYEKAVSYLDELKRGAKPGRYLQKNLGGINVATLSVEAFIEKLLQTKKPLIFAESAVAGDGSDWNLKELSLLGDISIATPVTIFDNGVHQKPDVHDQPFAGTLLFTAGALLANDSADTPPVDLAEVVVNGKLNQEAFYRLYERRLWPDFAYANQVAFQKGKKALITLPALGCGQFAGRFKGKLGVEFQKALHRFLDEHGASFKNIRAVFFGPYGECENARYELHGITYLVRPFLKGNQDKPQLCHPSIYSEAGDNFADCEFFSIVAWDHVSWPGNDYYGGSRATDDGVKAAATSSMLAMTGIEGYYDSKKFCYLPPTCFNSWEDVIDKNKLQLQVIGNLQILP